MKEKTANVNIDGVVCHNKLEARDKEREEESGGECVRVCMWCV